MQKSDVDLMRTKLRRLEEENSRKDRQIEQLLDASRVSAGPRTRCQMQASPAGEAQRTLSSSPNLLTTGPRFCSDSGRQKA